MNSENAPADEEPSSGLDAVLLEVARNLKSPPLLFAFGVIVAIVLAAIVAGDALGTMEVPLIVLGVGALVAWIVSEVIRARVRLSRRVDVRARDVAAGARVGGIDGQPVDRDVADVRVRADGVGTGGSVTGIRYAEEPRGSDPE